MTRARTWLWKHLVAGLSDDQRSRIARLFDGGDTAAFAALDALRTVPSTRAPTEFLRHLDRLEAVREFDLRPAMLKGVPAAPLERLARVARMSKPSAIAALREPRRTATVAALLHTLEAAAQDDAAELAEGLLTDLVKDAEAGVKKARLGSLRDLDAAAMLLREMGRLVMADDALPLDHRRDAPFERLPRVALETAMAEIDAIAQPAEARPYAELRARWRHARRLFFNIATRIEMDAAPGGQAVKAAVSHLKATPDWSGARLRDAPTEVVPKAWRRHVLDRDGKVDDPRAYVFAVIDAWRLAIKRREVARMAEPVEVRRFPAVLEPPEITPLAFDVGGRLGPLALRVGQGVRAGEVLASVEAQGADLRLRQAEAALAEAEAAAAEAGRDAGRQRQLFDRGAAARAEQARRALDLLREDVADTELRAPFDGVVDAVEAQSFGTVAAGQPVVTLYEDAGLQATVPVSYALAARLEVGAPARVRPLDGDPAPMPATVTEVARRAPTVSSFPVVVTLDGERPGLRSGMAVEVLIDLPAPEGARGLALPLSALATQRPSDLSGPEGRMAEVFVHVPGEGAAGTVEPRAVRIGAVEGTRMFVTQGLEPGERVATAGVPFLDPGMEVRLEEGAASADPSADDLVALPATAVAEAGR